MMMLAKRQNKNSKNTDDDRTGETTFGIWDDRIIIVTILVVVVASSEDRLLCACVPIEPSYRYHRLYGGLFYVCTHQRTGTFTLESKHLILPIGIIFRVGSSVRTRTGAEASICSHTGSWSLEQRVDSRSRE